MTITQSAFGVLPGGQAATVYTLTAGDLTAKITNYGGIITELWTPDKHGTPADVVLGYDNVNDYVEDSPYFGCIVGRYANRIAKGRFELDGKTYTLAVNNGDNHLHGGRMGFDKVLWDAEPSDSGDGPALMLRYRSADGEEGYPGNLDVTVVYTLTADGQLRIEYTAAADAPTLCNLTNHSYFNLAGHGCGDISGHIVTINADHYTPADAGGIPTGQIAPVAGTPMDLREPTAVGARIDADFEPLRLAGGYDHNWVLNKESNRLSPAARVEEPTGGRVMEVWTTEPGVQFYTGNYLDGTLIGKGGRTYPRRGGLCLETQHAPDSPNQPAFPSTVLRPGQTYRTTTIYKFIT